MPEPAGIKEMVKANNKNKLNPFKEHELS